jgi:hypothetical protein
MTSPAGIQFMLIMVVVVTLTQGVQLASSAIAGARRGRIAFFAFLRLSLVAVMSALCLWSCAYTLKALVVADVPLLGGSR